MRFLALGDSYTIGESVAARERWPVQLAEQLRAAGVACEDPAIVARTGWTTDELAAGLDRADLQGPFDLVTLLIGVNNQYRERSVAEYRLHFAELLARAVGLAGGKPERSLVLSIPDWSVTPFAQQDERPPAQIAAEIDAFNAANRAEAAKQQVAYVDVTAVSRQAAARPTLIAADGLHPSGEMYAAWVRLALPVVLSLLQAPPG